MSNRRLAPWQTSPFREGFDWEKIGGVPETNPWGDGCAGALFNKGREAARQYDRWIDLKRKMLKEQDDRSLQING